jgi:hypothetical protein
MAGGKESPRQKMIGMMYLVLTALLALNVSKSVLDAFVAIEENIQRGNIIQVDRGDISKRDLSTEMAGLLDDEAGKSKKLKIKGLLEIVSKIDKEAGSMIKFIDSIKLHILEKSGENIKAVKDKDKKTIIWKSYNPNIPLMPTRMNLDAVQAKDQFDVPMHEIIGADIKKLETDKIGIKLWKRYNNFRNFITGAAGSYKDGENQYLVKVKDINTFKSNAELAKGIKAMLFAAGNKMNKEDETALTSIYEELTKQELNDHHEQVNVHWISKTFDHSPLVAAIASLSSLQNEILVARVKAINLLKSKVTTGQYSFNKIQELVSGPGVASAGETIELKVTMAAYDSDNNPDVTGPGSISVANGIGTITLKAPQGGEMNLSGTVTIKDKSQVPTTKPWSWKVKIVEQAGAMEMPEFNILYKGYNNKIIGVGSGVISYTLNGKSATMVGGRPQFIINPSSLGQTTLTLMGTTKDGQSVKLASNTYDVKLMPRPSVKSKSISKSSGAKILVELLGSPINIGFTVLGGEVLVGDGFPFRGDFAPAAAVKSMKSGKSVGVIVQVKNNLTGEVYNVDGSLKVN